MTASISLNDLIQSLTNKGYTGSQEIIETTYKDLSFPWDRHYIGAAELDTLAVKVEIAAQMGYVPVGDVQIQTRSAIKSAASEFYKHFFVQAVQRECESTK
ncbi:hypothetical protein FAI41_03630 [Acetobacteraceae bacterium]|nr:hypothetical protein FAI41_03630 [Acetobacteraceae bacterium]